MSIDEQFNEIVQEALRKAAKVKCSVADYRAGLRGFIDETRIAIQASEESAEDAE